MSTKCDSNENLTTDAHPSPPREENASKPERLDNEEKHNLKYKKKKGAKKPTANAFSINNSTNIHIGNNTTINICKEQKLPREEVVKTATISKLLKRTDPVTTNTISFVSQHVGDNWRNVARKLNYSDGEIHQFYEKNITTSVREVVYQILLDWTQNKPEEAKLGTLCTALWKAPEKELVEKLANEFPL